MSLVRMTRRHVEVRHVPAKAVNKMRQNGWEVDESDAGDTGADEAEPPAEPPPKPKRRRSTRSTTTEPPETDSGGSSLPEHEKGNS